MRGERPEVRLQGNTLQAMEIHKSKARHAPKLCLVGGGGVGGNTGRSDHFSQIPEMKSSSPWRQDTGLAGWDARGEGGTAHINLSLYQQARLRQGWLVTESAAGLGRRFSGNGGSLSDHSLPSTITHFTVDTVIGQRSNSKGATGWSKRGDSKGTFPLASLPNLCLLELSLSFCAS